MKLPLGIQTYPLYAISTIYSSKKRLIPRPEFIVLYNGTDPYPDESILKLSESFEDTTLFGLITDSPPPLELAVKVYNINHGHNETIARNCQRLFWYSAFLAKIREFDNDAPDKETAMKMAIQYCIEHDIMKDFFEANASEVVNMLLTEWNWEDAKAVWWEEGREEGEHKVLELVKQGFSPEQIEKKLYATED